MELLLKLLLFVHVVLGFIGLAAFWVPVLSRKGGPPHRAFGRIYRNCAYLVLSTAFAAAIVRAATYLAAGHTPASQPEAFGFLVFLAYLALVTFVIVRHGVGVLAHKRNPQELDTRLNRTFGRLSIAASIGVIAYAAIVRPDNAVILYALSPVGIFSGLGMLRYIGNPPVSARGWLYEHLGAMLGGGIAFHTAFAVFGASRLFDFGLQGWVAVLPWIAPAAIGIPASALWTRHYRRKYGELA